MLQVIAEHLSVEEVEIIKDMFTLMDTDKDGKVTYEELKMLVFGGLGLILNSVCL